MEYKENIDIERDTSSEIENPSSRFHSSLSSGMCFCSPAEHQQCTIQSTLSNPNLSNINSTSPPSNTMTISTGVHHHSANSLTSPSAGHEHPVSTFWNDSNETLLWGPPCIAESTSLQSSISYDNLPRPKALRLDTGRQLSDNTVVCLATRSSDTCSSEKVLRSHTTPSSAYDSNKPFDRAVDVNTGSCRQQPDKNSLKKIDTDKTDLLECFGPAASHLSTSSDQLQPFLASKSAFTPIKVAECQFRPISSQTESYKMDNDLLNGHMSTIAALDESKQSRMFCISSSSHDFPPNGDYHSGSVMDWTECTQIPPFLHNLPLRPTPTNTPTPGSTGGYWRRWSSNTRCHSQPCCLNGHQTPSRCDCTFCCHVLQHTGFKSPITSPLGTVTSMATNHLSHAAHNSPSQQSHQQFPPPVSSTCKVRKSKHRHCQRHNHCCSSGNGQRRHGRRHSFLTSPNTGDLLVLSSGRHYLIGLPQFHHKANSSTGGRQAKLLSDLAKNLSTTSASSTSSTASWKRPRSCFPLYSSSGHSINDVVALLDYPELDLNQIEND